LLTLSLLRIAWIAWHWILFSILVLLARHHREWICHWRNIRTAVEDEGINLAQPGCRKMSM
jgi:hypothetical protein